MPFLRVRKSYFGPIMLPKTVLKKIGLWKLQMAILIYSLRSYLKKLHKNKLIPSRWMCGTQQYFKMSLSLAPVKNHWAILFAGVFISVRRNHKTQLLLIILYTKKWSEWIWCYIFSPSTAINYLPPRNADDICAASEIGSDLAKLWQHATENSGDGGNPKDIF